MTDKKTVISTLEEVALLLELAGANPFKVRAYQNGARALSSYEGDLQAGLESGELAKIKGVGKGLLAEIGALLENGRSPAHQVLSAEVPAGLLEMVKIPGLGPKKAQLLHEKLGITSVGELEYACLENRLVELSGFGPKSQAKILKGIDVVHRFAGRHLLSDAWELGEGLRERVSALPGVERCELAGSIRRRKETIKDIDLLVTVKDTATDTAPVMDAFVGFPEVDEVTGHGSTKSSVRMDNGMQVDLRVVETGQYPFALAYFTGSKEHNTVMRGRAKARGLRLNEYGLFPVGTDGEVADSSVSVSCAEEADIFAELGLREIPPELREDRGEFTAAEMGDNADSIHGGLPRLVEESDLRGILHNHSRYSDGAKSIEEMALAASALGYEYLGLSDHSQSAFYANGLKPEDIVRQHAEIDELNERLEGITILKGIESDILEDGSLDYDAEVLASFDFIVASVHSRFGLSGAEQTERCITAVMNPFATILGHPTGRLLLARDPFDVDMDAVMEAAAESG